MIKRSIEISVGHDGHWTVREGDTYCPHLCWDEMLGLLVRLTHTSGIPPYSMESTQQTVRRHEAREQRMCELEAKRIPF